MVATVLMKFQVAFKFIAGMLIRWPYGATINFNDLVKHVWMKVRKNCAMWKAISPNTCKRTKQINHRFPYGGSARDASQIEEKLTTDRNSQASWIENSWDPIWNPKSLSLKSRAVNIIALHLLMAMHRLFRLNHPLTACGVFLRVTKCAVNEPKMSGHDSRFLSVVRA